MSQIKKFFMNENTVIVNLTSNLCVTSSEILDSSGFKKVVSKFLLTIGDNSRRPLQTIKTINKSPDEMVELFKLLVVFQFDEIISKHSRFKKYLTYRKEIAEFIEALYSYWLNLERYGIVQRRLVEINTDNSIMIESTDSFSKNILSLYRFFLKKLLDKPIRINRQTPAGFSAGFIVTPEFYQFPPKYKFFKGINIVSGVVMRTPFIGHSSSNSRTGTFQEIDYNPLNYLRMTKRHWFCFPIKVGELLAYVFFHRTLMHHGVALCNTFEPGIEDYYKGRKPDLVYVYGGLKQEEDCTYYIDKENDFYLGYVARNEKNDFFGYMKDMILNLHNVYMIKHNILPIHGAMVNIVTKGNHEKNIVVIGDNNAGKSEIFKALKFIDNQKIVEMNVIFDNMGIFCLKDGSVCAKGTEIGAYMMLDDLKTGYAYEELDRAIFINPESNVPKIILSNTRYEFISRENKIDYVFYANNSKDSDVSIRIFNDINEMLKVFQEIELTDITGSSESKTLLEDVFSVMFKNKISFGELYTKPGISEEENKGNITAARSIVDLL